MQNNPKLLVEDSTKQRKHKIMLLTTSGVSSEKIYLLICRIVIISMGSSEILKLHINIYLCENCDSSLFNIQRSDHVSGWQTIRSLEEVGTPIT